MKQMVLADVKGSAKPVPRYEVHKHTFVSGPRANGTFIAERQQTTSTFAHSHEGGDEPHAHPDCGPATYTIDKDEWAARTGGMKGGSRKKFTSKPSGEQMPWQELEDWQKSFEIVYCDPPDGFKGTGGADAAAARMVSQFRMTAHVIDGRKRRA